MQSRLDNSDDIAVDMAPLIDCVFLLLIFFLVATTLKKLDRELPVQLPEASMAVDTKLAPDALVIGLDVEGELFLNAEPITIEQFHQTLREAAEANPATPIRIDADRLTPYQAIVHVMDQCMFWDLRNIGFHIRDRERRPKG